MNGLGFWRSLLLALGLSVVGAVSHAVLAPMLGVALSLRLVVLGLASIYVFALLGHSPARSGRALAVLAWIGLTGALLLFNPALSVWLVLQTGFIWLLRSLQLRSPARAVLDPGAAPIPASLLPATLDALLCTFALAAAVATAMHTRSLFLTLWSYFLIQALHAFIPGRQVLASAAAPDSDFDSALRNAQMALRRLSTR